MNSAPHPSVLMVHNRYQYPGGEDVAAAIEVELLRQAGHPVTFLETTNDRIKGFSKGQQVQLLLNTAWSRPAYREMRSHLQTLRPDLLHVQNFFPLYSPSVHAAARSLQIPTVQHLRNFRMACLNAYLLRHGQVCEACVGHNPWRGLVHRCYRDSLPASVGVWSMLSLNRWRGTWTREVDAFITPSHFAAQKLAQVGIPVDKLYVKPDSVEDPLGAEKIHPMPDSPRFLFVGRLSDQKGIKILLQAWQQLQQPSWQLDLIGTGDQEANCRQFVQEKELTNVRFLGHQTARQVLDHLRTATAVVVPSQSYETFGRVVAEAYACGRAAIVSTLGALGELVTPEVTGFVLPHLDIPAWTEALRWSGNHPSQMAAMGAQGRQLYLQRFTPEANYQRLIEIYHQVL